jgi:phosphoenolpyruvate synthase/pyruvate phosphate dikinase
VQIPTWLSLSQLPGYSVSQVGEWGTLLSRLHQHAIPLPPLFIIPTQTLHEIATHNHLADRVTQVVLRNQDQPQQLQPLVIQLFTELEIPREISRELLKAHSTYIKQNLASIVTSSTDTIGRGLSIELIQGESNMFESLLELWAHAYLKTKSLTNVAFIIQQQQQPTFSGYILTKDTQGGSAKQMPIWVTKGATPRVTKQHPFSRYSVDIRTWNVTYRQESAQAKQLARFPDELKSVSVPKTTPAQIADQTLSQIAQLAHQVKLLYLPHTCISWELHQSNIILTGLVPLGEEKLPQVAPKVAAAILQGNVVSPGYVSGVIQVGLPSVPPTQLPASTILVVPEVNMQHKPYLRFVSGLISEKPLPVFAQQIIQQTLLPTLAPARNACRRLKTGQHITLDANRGLITLSHKQPSAKAATPFTKTKVYLAVNNPAKIKSVNLKESDGTYFSSDFTFFQQGIHPQYLVRTQQNSDFTQVLIDRIKLFKPSAQVPLLYQPLTLTSSDLLQLQYAHSYEQEEKNPYLGYRGSIRHLHSFSVLNTELRALYLAQQAVGQNLGLVIPFTRTVSELRLMLNHIRTYFPHQPAPFELWWQIALPSNIWQIHQFLTPQLTGVIISVPDLHALVHGIDPSNPDLLLKYPLDIPLMRSMIKQVFAACPSHKIILQLSDVHEDLVQLAVELGLAGVIVKPYHAVRTKRVISELETQVLQHI